MKLHGRLYAMLTKILFAWCLVATTVIFHTAAPDGRTESSVAPGYAAGDALLARNMAIGSDHLVAHGNSLR